MAKFYILSHYDSYEKTEAVHKYEDNLGKCEVEMSSVAIIRSKEVCLKAKMDKVITNHITSS